MAEWMYHKPSGSWEQIPDKEVQERFLTGEYGLDPNKPIPVTDNSGKGFLIPAAEAAKALQSGHFQYESKYDQQRRKFREGTAGAGGSAMAGGFGFLRGVTLGVSDKLIAESQKIASVPVFNKRGDYIGDIGGRRGSFVGATPHALEEFEEVRDQYEHLERDKYGTVIRKGEDTPHGQVTSALKSLRDEHKAESIVGELLGVAAGSRAGGTPAGIMATAGHAAKSGTAKLMGTRAATSLGRKLGERVLPLVAQGATEGTFYGAGMALSESAIEDFDLTGEKVIAHAGMGALLGGGIMGLWGVGGVLSSEVAAMGRKLVPKYANSSVASKLREFANYRRVKATGIRGKELKKLYKEGRIDELGEWLKKHGTTAVQNDLDEILANATRIKKSSGHRMGALLDEVDRAGRTFDMAGFVRSIDDEMAMGIGESKSALRSLTGRRARRSTWRKIRRWLDDFIDDGEKVPYKRVWENRKALDADIPRKPWSEMSPDEKALQELRNRLEAEFMRQADDAVESMGRRGFKGEYRAAKADYAKAATVVEGAEAEAFRRLNNRWASPTDYGAAATGLIAGGIGPRGLTLGLIGGLINRTVRHRGNQIAAAVADRAASLGALQKISNDVSKRTQQSILSFLTKGVRPAQTPAALRILEEVSYSSEPVEPAKTRADAFHARAAELADLVSDPEEFTNRVTARLGELTDISPELASSMATTAARAAHFLHSKAPKNPAASRTLNPAVHKWQPSDVELAKFARYVAAVEDPLSVLEEMEQGRVSREGVEVLREVYPSLYAQIQTEYLEHITELQTGLDYQSRLLLSRLFEVPVESSAAPDFVAGIQQIHAAMEQDDAQQQAQNRKNIRSGAKFTLADKSLTSSQRMLSEAPNA